MDEELLLVDQAGVADSRADETRQDADGVALLTAEATAVHVATNEEAKEDDGQTLEEDSPW